MQLQILWAVVALGGVTVLQAVDPAKVDPSERNRIDGQVAPITVAPEEMERADYLTEKIVEPDRLEMARSSLLETKAPIDLEETRPKQTLTPGKRSPETQLWPKVETHAWSGERASWQTEQRSTLNPELMERYQSRMRDASKAADRSAEMTTTGGGFSALNRFVFRRNRPAEPAVTPAGGASR